MNKIFSFIGIGILGCSFLCGVDQEEKGTFIEGAGKVEKVEGLNPIFYPANYDTDSVNEYYYDTQDEYSFTPMNFVQTQDFYRGDAVKVAVIDSGLNYEHEDFILNGDYIIQPTSRTIDNSSGEWLFYQFTADPSKGYGAYPTKINDTLGHGTNVASVIASQINNVGCAGIAPNVELYIYKVTNTSNGYEWTAINSALQYCIDEGMDVVNMSFQAYEKSVTYNGSTMPESTGCSSVMTSMLNACHNAGITLVAAAGNYNTYERSYPASNNYVISVGSLAKSSTTAKAGYSNLTDIDLVAPGSVYVADKGSYRSYKETQGTSFSAPIVTAAIALYKQKYPSATPAQIESALYASCDSIENTPSWAGNGRLNIDNFLNISNETRTAPTGVSIYSDRDNVVRDGTIQFKASVNPSSSNDKVVSWTSSNTTVGTINSNGLFTGKTAGQTTITATTHTGGYQAQKTITVNPAATSLSVTDPFTVGVGETKEIEVTAHYENDTESVLSLGDFDLDITDPSICTYENGQITGVATGQTTGYILGPDDTDLEFDIEVTENVEPATVSSVTVSPASLSLDLNGTKTGNLTATVNGTNNPSQTVNWTSGNTNIATVSASGVVTAKAVGSTTITATSALDGTKSGSCTVTVSDSAVHVTGVSVSPSTLGINVGETSTLTATIEPSNATNKNVTWTSSNTSKVTVTSAGLITGVAAGNATITATTVDGSFNASCTVTVTAVQSQTLTITMNSFTDASTAYSWYNWSETTSDSFTVSGKGELYQATGMQFNKGKGNGVAAIFNTVAIPGTITSISAKTLSGTNRAWNAYVTSTACSGSGSTLTFGSNKTRVGSSYVTIGSSQTSFGNTNTGYSYFCLQENENGASTLDNITITYTPKSIKSIAIKTAPTKTAYETGDNFNPAGLAITVTYNDNTTTDVTYAGNENKFTFSPTTSTALTTDNTSVTITYGGKSTSQAITVTQGKVLSSISISEYTTTFAEGDAFAFGGTVTAHFTGAADENVTASATFSGYTMTTTGNQTVTVSYTYKGITKTASYSITINPGTLSSIALSGQTTTYQKNAAFSFTGTCTATFANGYEKAVAPTSVSSPDMTTGGQKTVTVSYTYNGVTKTANYTITVNTQRTVIEAVYSTIGTVSYTSGSEVISVNTLSTSKSGYTNLENAPDTSHKGIRLGSGNNKGTITITSTTTNIYKVVVNARVYSSDSPVTMTIGGSSNTLTSSYADYVKEYATATNSVAIATTTNGKRAWVSTITVFTKSNEDIGSSADCVGLETFINTYMHMDYTQNLGYCKDDEHHYYNTAKGAFNALNDHQRSLFTSNSAYSVEWERLRTWALANGESLNTTNNQLSINKNTTPMSDVLSSDNAVIVLAVALTISSLFTITLYLKKKKR